jgi:SSS family solute:Na+ symporter/sodium/pantothenate symporter
MPELPTSAGYGTLFALCLLIGASVWLGTIAQRVVERSSFVKGYFIGNRGLGAWALALTATVQSGGTFMGFPSLVYSYGWTVALWIAAYMVVPITGFGVLGKRVAQLSRRTGAITVPDLFRERYGDARVGVAALCFVLFFMTFMMVAQFKAGAIIMKVAWPGSGALAISEDVAVYDKFYYIGLAIFACTVVGYTLIGGFLAAVWSDLFQSVMMFLGVVILLILIVPAAGGLEQATLTAVEHTDDTYVFGPGYSPQGRIFLPLGLSLSFFFVWVWSGVGSPASLVRIMACKDTPTIRRSIFLLAAYNSMIYIPLIVICICGRALLPDLPSGKSDEIIPRLAILATSQLPLNSFIAGLILVAPFGAVMATVSSYLVVIASGLIHDLYQKFINPEADRTHIRRLTYLTMIIVGGIAVCANIRPVDYLQAIVVFSGTGAAATFCMPSLMLSYWRRATAAGTIASMLAGFGTMMTLYGYGFFRALSGYDRGIGPATSFRPYFLLDCDPLVWGLLVSLIAGVVVSLLTKPPSPELVSKLFDAQPQNNKQPQTAPATATA